jgi:amino-acid N-acetyltransferase
MTTEIRNCDCLELRTAREGDLQEILALLGRAQLPTAGVAESLSHFIVAEHEGDLIGVAGLEVYGASALLRSVAVEESWRGSGVGRTLIDRALYQARQAAIEDVYLLTTTAERYFPRFGFSCVGRDEVGKEIRASVEFQDACPASAVVMRKSFELDRP